MPAPVAYLLACPSDYCVAELVVMQQRPATRTGCYGRRPQLGSGGAAELNNFRILNKDMVGQIECL